MNNLDKLINAVRFTSPDIANKIQEEFHSMRQRYPLGMVWDNYSHETIINPTRPVRQGDMVIVVSTDTDTRSTDRFQVIRLSGRGSARMAHLIPEYGDDSEEVSFPVSDVRVCNDSDTPLFPGLQHTGSVLHGGDSPSHSVINAENIDALKMMQYTHHGVFDVIHIRPPSRYGWKSWSYHTNYGDGTEVLSSSAWLSMLEKRLLLAKNLLNKTSSTVIVSVDNSDYLHTGMLLKQLFPGCVIQMVSTVVHRSGSAKRGIFSQTDEYTFYVHNGNSMVSPLVLDSQWNTTYKDTTRHNPWSSLMRGGSNGRREKSPKCFYPIFVKESEGETVIVSIGDTYIGSEWKDIEVPEGTHAVWPVTAQGEERAWGVLPDRLRDMHTKGYVYPGRFNGEHTSMRYLRRGNIERVENGTIPVLGTTVGGTLILDRQFDKTMVPGTQWNIPSHDAHHHGSMMVSSFVPGITHFPSQSLYKVEDVLRFVVADKPDAKILDFFGGSGTTLHAVMRLNAEDGGNRQCVVVENNKVSPDDENMLRKQGYRPGDMQWEQHGLCTSVTTPRIKSAVTGKAISLKSKRAKNIKGMYTANKKTMMSDGHDANVRFFTMTYESQSFVSLGRSMKKIEPLLWLRAGGQGDILHAGSTGYAVGDHYAVLSDLSSVHSLSLEMSQYACPIIFVMADSGAVTNSVVTQFPDKQVINVIDDYMDTFSTPWH